jgi:hypothetical protein
MLGIELHAFSSRSGLIAKFRNDEKATTIEKKSSFCDFCGLY